MSRKICVWRGVRSDISAYLFIRTVTVIISRSWRTAREIASAVRSQSKKKGKTLAHGSSDRAASEGIPGGTGSRATGDPKRERVSNASFAGLVEYALHTHARTRGIKSYDMHRVSARGSERPSSLHHLDSDTVQSDHVPYAPQKVLTGVCLHASLSPCLSICKTPYRPKAHAYNPVATSRRDNLSTVAFQRQI
jgi:hypothetical protein